MVDNPFVGDHLTVDNPEWQQVYCEALAEQDSSQIANACGRARRAINDQLLVLAREGSAARQTVEALLEALRQLVIHESA
jgi:hypothetical protein